MSSVFPAFGAAVALAGFDKLIGQRGYERMFDHLNWSDDQVRAASVAEVAGGLLMAIPATRRLGGGVVAAVSLALLRSELRHGDAGLAVPRGLLLLGALGAAIAPG